MMTSNNVGNTYPAGAYKSYIPCIQANSKDYTKNMRRPTNKTIFQRYHTTALMAVIAKGKEQSPRSYKQQHTSLMQNIPHQSVQGPATPERLIHSLAMLAPSLQEP